MDNPSMPSPANADGNWDQRVLIAAPLGRDAEVLGRILLDAGIDSIACPEMPDLCNKIGEGAAAVILAEEALTPHSQLILAKTLVQQPEWSDLPIIVMAADPNAGSRGWQLLNQTSGYAHAVLLPRPIGKTTLLSSVRSGASIMRSAIPGSRRVAPPGASRGSPATKRTPLSLAVAPIAGRGLYVRGPIGPDHLL